MLQAKGSSEDGATADCLSRYSLLCTATRRTKTESLCIGRDKVYPRHLRATARTPPLSLSSLSLLATSRMQAHRGLQIPAFFKLSQGRVARRRRRRAFLRHANSAAALILALLFGPVAASPKPVPLHSLAGAMHLAEAAVAGVLLGGAVSHPHAQCPARAARRRVFSTQAEGAEGAEGSEGAEGAGAPAIPHCTAAP